MLTGTPSLELPHVAAIADECWPPAWASTIRAHTNPALECPRRRDDVECFESPDGSAASAGSEARWVLRRWVTSRYVRIGSIEHDTWQCLDGVRTVLDIAKEVGRRHSMLALPVVEAFVGKLDSFGMIDASPQDRVYTQLSMTFASEGLAGRMRWMRQTFFYRRIPIAGFGPLINHSYHLFGRWLYTRLAAAVMVLVSILGFISYVRLGLPKPDALPRWQLIAGGLVALATIVVHEFAHGWTVRHFGRDVHRAGVFLMYGLPGAFVDTTDMWLGTKRQRLAVTAAGPASNVVLSGVLALVATIQPGARGLWLTAAGGSYAFVGANLLPLLKLDGYYLLMDALGVADLRERGIAFSISQLVPRWREAWRRGEVWPKLAREERLLATYGSIALAFLVFLGASSLLVMPHRIEATIGKARRGELHGALLVIVATMTVFGLTIFVLNLIASRNQLAATFARASRSLAAKRAAPLLVIHAALAGVLAWLVPAVAGRRDAAAGSEWTRVAAVFAGAIAVRCAWRLFTVARGLAIRWLFIAVSMHAAACATAAMFDRARPVAVGTAAITLAALILSSRFWVRTLPGTIGGAWVLTLAGVLATLAGAGALLRTGLCLLAVGLMLARLLWVHVPERIVGLVDLPANERVDDVRGARHLSRVVSFVAESMLGRAVDVLGDASRAELAFAVNSRMAGLVDVWFTSDGRFSDRTSGGCAERAPLYADALVGIADVVGARLGRSFADDSLTAAALDLPTRAEELFASQILSRPNFAEARDVVRGVDGTVDAHDARRLVTRHYADFVLQAARRIFGDSVIESVVARVNANSSTGATLWLRGNGRLAASDGRLAIGEGHDFLARVFGALAGSVGASWTRTAVRVADDALAWQLREATADDDLVPSTWERGASLRLAGRVVSSSSAAAVVARELDPMVSTEGAPTLRRRAIPIGFVPRVATTESSLLRAHMEKSEVADDGAAPPVRRRAAAIPVESPGSTAGAAPATAASASGSTPVPVPAAMPKGAPAVLVVPVLAGFLAAVLIGAYARIHAPTGQSSWHPFFSRMITFKSWSATAAFACAVFQVATGTIVHRRRDPLATSSPLAALHRLSGFAAFVLTLPVAFHCLWALGFAPSIGLNRRFVHSVAGCLLYGGYATKVLAVSRRGRPRWALPVIGSGLFVAFALVAASSAGWFFRAQGFQW